MNVNNNKAICDCDICSKMRMAEEEHRILFHEMINYHQEKLSSSKKIITELLEFIEQHSLLEEFVGK